jgi:predicted Zn finger-like uncharacterized protein
LLIMILTCPDCGTQYVVKDDAIPPEGRQVRCAACKHSWHQDPEPQSAEAPVEAEPDAAPQQTSEPEAIQEPGENISPDEPRQEAAPDEDESFTEATVIDPRSGPEAEERAYEEAALEEETIAPDADVAPGAEAPTGIEVTAAGEVETAAEDWKEPPQAEATPDVFSPFATPDEEEPKRRSPLTTIVIVAVLIIIIAALFWLFAPIELKARLGLAAGGKSPLTLVMTHMDRQPLESGNQLLTVSGRVINPTANEQDVPPLQARLTDHSGKVVYKWTIPPPAPSLAPGASASFNSAELKVPPGGEYLTITAGPKA